MCRNMLSSGNSKQGIDFLLLLDEKSVMFGLPVVAYS
jgi:hypothetical protein